MAGRTCGLPEPGLPARRQRQCQRIVVLVSGFGRNLQALIEHCAQGRIEADIVGVVSSRAGAPALQRAAKAGIPTRVLEPAGFAHRQDHDRALLATVRALQPDLVLLAGYMRILDVAFVEHYVGRLLNVHPSLLPRYPGLHTHRRVLAAGDAVHGATVHFVSAELDGGPAIIQGGVSVSADDDEQSLSERVMNAVELNIYPWAAAAFCRGELELRAGRVWWNGRRLDSPLQWPDLQQDRS